MAALWLSPCEGGAVDAGREPEWSTRCSSAFSFVLIEWTSGPVAVLPFVGNSAVPRTAVRVAITLRRPEIVSLLPEDLQNQKRIRAGSGVVWFTR